MKNYSVSTMEEISDIQNGMRVETSAMANATYMASSQQEIFNVFGRIKVTALFGEAVTTGSNNATTLKFNYTSTTPVIAVANMTAASVGVWTNAVVGTQVGCPGGAIANAAVVGTGKVCGMTPMIIGLKDGIGTIGILTAAASQTSGTTRFTICYVPMSDGAYVTAAH